MFVACSESQQVGVVDLKTDKLLTLLDVGKTPVHLVVKPDGGEVFVSNYDASSISEIVTSTNEVNNTFQIGDHPARGLVSPGQCAAVCGEFWLRFGSGVQH